MLCVRDHGAGAYVKARQPERDVILADGTTHAGRTPIGSENGRPSDRPSIERLSSGTPEGPDEHCADREDDERRAQRNDLYRLLAVVTEEETDKCSP